MKNAADEMYLQGNRLIKFLTAVLPLHPQYHSSHEDLVEAREECQLMLADVGRLLATVALFIDRRCHGVGVQRVISEEGGLEDDSCSSDGEDSSCGSSSEEEGSELESIIEGDEEDEEEEEDGHSIVKVHTANAHGDAESQYSFSGEKQAPPGPLLSRGQARPTPPPPSSHPDVQPCG